MRNINIPVRRCCSGHTSCHCNVCCCRDRKEGINIEGKECDENNNKRERRNHKNLFVTDTVLHRGPVVPAASDLPLLDTSRGPALSATSAAAPPATVTFADAAVTSLAATVAATIVAVTATATAATSMVMTMASMNRLCYPSGHQLGKWDRTIPSRNELYPLASIVW